MSHDIRDPDTTTAAKTPDIHRRSEPDDMRNPQLGRQREMRAIFLRMREELDDMGVQ